MKRFWVGVLIVTIFLAIVSLPRLVLVPKLLQGLEDQVAESFQAENVQVMIKAPWGWELLFGRLPRLDIVAENARIHSLPVSKVTVRGEQIRFDPRSLWKEQELVYTEASNLWGEMIVTEEALNELFWQRVDPDRLLSLQVSERGIGLGGKVSFWNMQWALTLLGELEVHQGTSLRFVLKNVEVQETRIPPILLEVLRENYDFVIDLGVFPYPVELREVRLEEKQILVTFGGLQ
ncbi:MAG TPA: hypothetical protein DDW87_02630 [Firmicutes bacterium]|nr:hypothetical protein [Bacillota bacterium]